MRHRYGPLNDEREAQFVTALLLLGAPRHLASALKFGWSGGAPRLAYKEFVRHKKRLIWHLEDANYFDVYWSSYEVTGGLLTEMAALWIADFYQWTMHQQDLQRFVT